jgi:hypothetical protein
METATDLPMNYGAIVRKLSMGAALLTTALAVSSCSQPPAPPAATQPSEVGRYQVVVTTEGDPGSTLLLVDTKEGQTWLYHSAQGPAFNGFWSNIPKIQVADAYWESALRSALTPPPPPPDANATAVQPPSPSGTPPLPKP